MEFRWVVALTLWTMLSGPVLCEWTMATTHASRNNRPAASKQVSSPPSYGGPAKNGRPAGK